MLVQVSQADLEAWQQHDVYFASNVGSVCRGMTTRQVAAFFDKGLLCVRAYEPSTGGCLCHLKKRLWSQTPASCRVDVLYSCILRTGIYQIASELVITYPCQSFHAVRTFCLRQDGIHMPPCLNRSGAPAGGITCAEYPYYR